MAIEPSLAEHARTALALATSATLVTEGCPGSRALTVVSMEDQSDGRPLVRLAHGSPTVEALARCPVATLVVAVSAPYGTLHLTGPLQRRRSDQPGRRCYRMSVLTVRLVGPTTVPIPVGELDAARPDPLRSWAPATLQHLEVAHAAELLACVRAHGHDDAVAALPRALDRYGIELVSLGEEGVDVVRLPFPGGPVERLDEVAGGLRAVLTCRCGRRP